MELILATKCGWNFYRHMLIVTQDYAGHSVYMISHLQSLQPHCELTDGETEIQWY